MTNDRQKQGMSAAAEPANSMPTYYVTYAVLKRHSYIVISRTHPNDPSKTVALASFGLYAAMSSFSVFAHVALNGALSREGRVQSEHFLIDNYPASAKGKSFAITQAQAESVLNKVKQDAQTSSSQPQATKGRKYELTLISEQEFNNLKPHQKKQPYLLATADNKYRIWGYKEDTNTWEHTEMDSTFKMPRTWAGKRKVWALPTDDIFDALKKGHVQQCIKPDCFDQLTQAEQEHYLYFRNEMSRYIHGPSFNVRDFNCKKYAIHILRYLGIKDAGIEKHWFPTLNFTDNKRVSFNSSISALNIKERRNDKVHYPANYYKIYAQGTTPAEKALALLKDYVGSSLKNSLLHFKRHHKKDIRELIIQLEAAIKESPEYYNNIKNIVDHVTHKTTSFRNMTGSLQKRLDFLLEQSSQTVPSPSPESIRQPKISRLSKKNTLS